ncbi:MAG TPA: membrane dipeptidase [Candidatus Scatomorpha stercorigallinarum]|nr:membrane dipeptidase [Candidatus Scatomorpha stercorigallinarum]
MDIPYFDAHCDTLSVLHSRGAEWSLGANAAEVDIDRLSAYSPAAQVFAIWGGHYEEKLALLRRSLARDGRAVLCRTAEEVRKANAAGKVAALLSVEGAEILGCSIERLREARERDGLAMINLCWNSDNALCGAAMDSGSGLTDAGRAFVRAAQDVGVAVDLSHASERTFWDVLEIAEKPVIASHSNAAALSSEFPRNLTDEQFTALVKCGGGAGLNLCADFIGLGRDIGACCAHIEHFLALGGEKSLFLGTDFDGIAAVPRGLYGVQDMWKLYEALLERGHSEELVQDIFYGDLLRILGRTA